MSSSMVAGKIKAAASCAILAHVSPDGDTLGSSLALSHALCRIGIANDVYCEDDVPRVYQILPGYTKIQKPSQEAMVYPLAISVDVSDFKRLGSCAAIFEKAQERIVVDHHMTNPKFGDVNLIEARAATADIVLSIIDHLEVSLDQEIATCLYVALSTDTGNFNYSNTTGDALRSAGRLVDAGIDVAYITEKTYRVRSPQKTKLIGRAIGNMRLEAQGRVAMMSLTMEDYLQCGATDADSEGLINYCMECEGVLVAFMARETERGIKCSMRSNGALDVGTFASGFDGGGHVNASGFTIHTSLEQTMQQVYDAVTKALSL